ncbi:MAG: hypothetical protein LBR07_02245, partial [Puniceicoccales bacterium]|nr:hypothetical protein [Puniceicoccales bacterium]
DKAAFATPPRVNFPQTWFHFLGGNVSREGITADLSAIAGAGISGVQLFHGSQGNWPWPGTKEQITCLSPKWDDTVRFAAEEARRLGLRFTMQNCPGWSMAGGPWVKPEDAQRRLVWSATQVELKPTAGSTVGGSQKLVVKLPHPPGTAPAAKNPAADYRDIAVLAFPTPLGWETGQWLRPLSPVATRNVAGAPAAPKDFPWRGIFDGTASRKRGPLPVLPPAPAGRPWQIEVAFAAGETPRSVELPPVKQMAGNGWEYDPRLTFAFSAVFADGSTRPLLETPLPQSAWQNNHNTTLALPEVRDAAGAPPVAFRVAITNAHPLSLAFVRFTSSAKPHNYEAEAGWTLRGKIRAGESPAQNPAAFVPEDAVVDVSEFFDAATGVLNWERGAGSGERGNYTFLRFGHINAGHRNAPAPREGTGWECDKLSERGPDAHFAGYIGRLAKGPLAGGLLQGVLLDSWECYTQTWTRDLERDFAERARYPLRRWLPAVAGYVVGDHSRTNRFLLDWRRVIGDLFANKFYGRMAKLARDAALDITYETAAGDIFPADLLEYYKHADVPMTEFWQPFEPRFVGSINFKPIKPAASAARLYGKRRTAAEAFTSFQLTWDERLADFKEIGNFNATEGVTHLVFHTYSHNPQTGDAYHPPGTSFAAGIGSPFLRGQTWWKFMPEFTTYFARLGYMLERGVPVSDFLWFLGDEIVHKPDQRALTPLGHKYDYCNPDILRHRLSVDAAGNIVTPEGLTYRVLWLPDCRRLTIETLEALARLRRAGAVLAGNPPLEPATLTGGEPARLRFAQLVREIWGTAGTTAGESTAGESTAGGGASSVLPVYGQKRGRVITGATDLAALTAALRATGTAPDLLADGDAAALAAAPVFRDAAGFPHTDDIHGLLWT